MQFSVEKKECNQCIFNIEVSAKEVEKEISKRINKIVKTGKIDGFRPGKVPIKIIKEKYGFQIRNEVVRGILPQKYNEVLSQEKLTAIVSKFEITQNEERKALKFNVNVELFPKIDMINLEKIKIIKPVVIISDADIKKMAVKIRKQFITWHEINRPVLKNDKVVINFVGHINGNKFIFYINSSPRDKNI